MAGSELVLHDLQKKPLRLFFRDLPCLGLHGPPLPGGSHPQRLLDTGGRHVIPFHFLQDLDLSEFGRKKSEIFDRGGHIREDAVRTL